MSTETNDDRLIMIEGRLLAMELIFRSVVFGVAMEKPAPVEFLRKWRADTFAGLQLAERQIDDRADAVWKVMVANFDAFFNAAEGAVKLQLAQRGDRKGKGSKWKERSRLFSRTRDSASSDEAMVKAICSFTFRTSRTNSSMRLTSGHKSSSRSQSVIGIRSRWRRRLA
jgi:hypothetical protein